METNGNSRQDPHQDVTQLFDVAAAKSIAVICNLDAEPEMARFLHFVQSHPEQREFVVQLFIDSFSESFYMRHAPSEFLMYCMHDLRWPEIRDFIVKRRDVEVAKRGVACSGIWNGILEAYEDNWEAAKYYEEFKQTAGVSAGR